MTDGLASSILPDPGTSLDGRGSVGLSGVVAEVGQVEITAFVDGYERTSGRRPWGPMAGSRSPTISRAISSRS